MLADEDDGVFELVLGLPGEVGVVHEGGSGDEGNGDDCDVLVGFDDEVRWSQHPDFLDVVVVGELDVLDEGILPLVLDFQLLQLVEGDHIALAEDQLGPSAAQLPCHADGVAVVVNAVLDDILGEQLDLWMHSVEEQALHRGQAQVALPLMLKALHGQDVLHRVVQLLVLHLHKDEGLLHMHQLHCLCPVHDAEVQIFVGFFKEAKKPHISQGDLGDVLVENQSREQLIP